MWDKIIDFINKYTNLCLIISFTLMFFLIFFIIIRPAEAALPYVQNFDSLDNGNFTAWELMTGNPVQVIDSENNYFGAKILDIDLPNPPATFYRYNFSPDSSSGVYASAWIKTQGNDNDKASVIFYDQEGIFRIQSLGVWGQSLTCGQTKFQNISANKWYWIQAETRTSDQKVRCRWKEYGGDLSNWSSYYENGQGWSGPGSVGYIGLYAQSGSSHILMDNIKMGSGSASDNDLPPDPDPVNNLSITYPANNSTTTALNYFTLQLFTDQNYATGTPRFTVYYGSSTTTWDYSSTIYGPLPGITKNSTTTRDVYISDLFSVGGPYYAYANFSTSSSIVNSEIISFYISEYATSSYYDPILPATTTESFLNSCSNFGWPINWFCDAMSFLFVPNQEVLNEFMRIKNNVFVLKPFGYLTLIDDVWKNLKLENKEAPKLEMTSPFNSTQKITLFDMSAMGETTKNKLRELSTWILYITFFGWVAETIINLFKL